MFSLVLQVSNTNYRPRPIELGLQRPQPRAYDIYSSWPYTAVSWTRFIAPGLYLPSYILSSVYYLHGHFLNSFWMAKCARDFEICDSERPLNLPFFKTTSPSCTTYFRGEQAVDASTEITALGWCSSFHTTFGITGFSLLFDWPCHLQDSLLIHFGPTMLRCQCWPLACWQDLRVSF